MQKKYSTTTSHSGISYCICSSKLLVQSQDNRKVHFQPLFNCPFGNQYHRRKQIFKDAKGLNRHLSKVHNGSTNYAKIYNEEALAYYKLHDEWIRANPAQPVDPATDAYPDFVPVTFCFRITLKCIWIIVQPKYICPYKFICKHTHAFPDASDYNRHLKTEFHADQTYVSYVTRKKIAEVEYNTNRVIWYLSRPRVPTHREPVEVYWHWY